MIETITEHNKHLYKSEIELLFRFRHWFFVDRMGWEDLRKQDGREIDQFDGDDAIHFASFSGGRPVSYSRLIPTTKGHLLSDVYAELTGGETYEVGEDIYEWTRFSVDPNFGNPKEFNNEAKRLFHAVAEFCTSNEIKRLLIQSHPVYMNWFLETDWNVEPMGLPMTYKEALVIAYYVEPTAETLANGKIDLNMQGTLLNDRLSQFPQNDSTLRQAS